MIEEAYVSFETAKLLKEKGFNEKSRYYYRDHDKALVSVSLMCGYSVIRNEDLIDDYAVPTQQMAMRWLREVHKLYVNILYSEYLYGNKPFYWCIERLNEKSIYERIIKTSTATREYTYGTYEEAVEAAIKYCLENLI